RRASTLPVRLPTLRRSSLRDRGAGTRARGCSARPRPLERGGHRSQFFHPLSMARSSPPWSNLLEGDAHMNATVTRMAVTLGAGLIALGVSAGAYVHAQDQQTNPQPPPF